MLGVLTFGTRSRVHTSLPKMDFFLFAYLSMGDPVTDLALLGGAYEVGEETGILPWFKKEIKAYGKELFKQASSDAREGLNTHLREGYHQGRKRVADWVDERVPWRRRGTRAPLYIEGDPGPLIEEIEDHEAAIQGYKQSSSRVEQEIAVAEQVHRIQAQPNTNRVAVLDKYVAGPAEHCLRPSNPLTR